MVAVADAVRRRISRPAAYDRDPMSISQRTAARLSFVALYAAVGASYPYLGVFYAERGLDLAAIGLLTALGAAVGLVAAPLWGVLAARYAGSPFVISIAAVVNAPGTLTVGPSAAGSLPW